MTLRELRDSRKLTCQEMANAMGISIKTYKTREKDFSTCKAHEVAKLIPNINLSKDELTNLIENR